MHTQQLLKVLMERSGVNPNSLSSHLKNKVRQPQIHKFLTGATKEPKRSTLEPIASAYGISPEVFFDEQLAEELLAQIDSGEFVVQLGRTVRKAAKRTVTVVTIGLDSAVETLALHINSIDDAEKREEIGQRLLTLARAPDSAKALDGVINAFQASTSATKGPSSDPLPTILQGGATLARKLMTETKDFVKEPSKGEQPS